MAAIFVGGGETESVLVHNNILVVADTLNSAVNCVEIACMILKVAQRI